MSVLLQALRDHAQSMPDHIALNDGREHLTYAQLSSTVDSLAARLSTLSPNRIGLFADNGIAWVLVDLAAMRAGISIIPMPMFASQEQIAHAVCTASIDYVLTDSHKRLCDALPADTHLKMAPFSHGLLGLQLQDRGSQITPLPDGCWKVTFTSGTTGRPKGVCLSLAALERSADSLRQASVGTSADRHLCVLPLATLLENIGVYAALLAGATVCIPRLSEVGLCGSSGLDVSRLLDSLRTWNASSAILVPQMLSAMVGAIDSTVPPFESLRFLAVGGAALPARVLERALALGMPVYEGYGLSECASVVTVNRLGACRPGSVGRTLAHVRLEIAKDGEVLVDSDAFLGYLGDPPAKRKRGLFATGDIGFVDEGGYLYITGRKKNVFVTSFGRNVVPEWIEQELVSHSAIAQAAVFGEARPFNAAIIVANASATDASIDSAVREVNAHLPDYARVRAWIRAASPFAPDNEMSTANGRLRRSVIYGAYASALDAIYDNERVAD